MDENLNPAAIALDPSLAKPQPEEELSGADLEQARMNPAAMALNPRLGDITSREAAERVPKAGLAVGRSWEDTAAELRKVGLNPEPFRQQYQLEQARKNEPDVGMGEEFARTSILGYSAIRNYREESRYGDALKRLKENKATDEDMKTIAHHENLQRIDEWKQSTLGGQVVNALGQAPAILGEAAVGGAVAGRIIPVLGTAAARGAPLAAAVNPSIGSQLLASAGRQTIGLAAMPSQWLAQGAERNVAAGREASDIRGYGAPVLQAYATNYILGSLQGKWGSSGSLADRIVQKTFLGLGEQQGADLLLGTLDQIIPENMETKTRFGVLGSVLRSGRALADGDTEGAQKEITTAFQHATVQMLTFSLFAGLHELQQAHADKPLPLEFSALSEKDRSRMQAAAKDVSDGFKSAVDEMSAKGFSQRLAGERLSDLQDRLMKAQADAANSGRDFTKGEGRALFDNLPAGKVKDYAMSLTDRLPTPREGDVPRGKGVMAPAPEKAGPPAPPSLKAETEATIQRERLSGDQAKAFRVAADDIQAKHGDDALHAWLSGGEPGLHAHLLSTARAEAAGHETALRAHEQVVADSAVKVKALQDQLLIAKEGTKAGTEIRSQINAEKKKAAIVRKAIREVQPKLEEARTRAQAAEAGVRTTVGPPQPFKSLLRPPAPPRLLKRPPRGKPAPAAETPAEKPVEQPGANAEFYHITSYKNSKKSVDDAVSMLGSRGHPPKPMDVWLDSHHALSNSRPGTAIFVFNRDRYKGTVEERSECIGSANHGGVPLPFDPSLTHVFYNGERGDAGYKRLEEIIKETNEKRNDAELMRSHGHDGALPPIKLEASKEPAELPKPAPEPATPTPETKPLHDEFKETVDGVRSQLADTAPAPGGELRPEEVEKAALSGADKVASSVKPGDEEEALRTVESAEATHRRATADRRTDVEEAQKKRLETAWDQMDAEQRKEFGEKNPDVIERMIDLDIDLDRPPGSLHEEPGTELDRMSKEADLPVKESEALRLLVMGRTMRDAAKEMHEAGTLKKPTNQQSVSNWAARAFSKLKAKFPDQFADVNTVDELVLREGSERGRSLVAGTRAKANTGDLETSTPGGKAGQVIPKHGLLASPPAAAAAEGGGGGEGEAARTPSEIIAFDKKQHSVPIYRERRLGIPGAAGTYDPHAQAAAVTTMSAQSLAVNLHEIAHHIEATNKLPLDSFPEDVQRGLQSFNYDPKTFTGRRGLSEGFAEWYRKRQTDELGDMTKDERAADDFLERWAKAQGLTEKFNKTRDLFERYAEQSAAEKFGALISKTGEPAMPPPGPAKERLKEYADEALSSQIRKKLDDLYDFTRAEKRDAAIRSSRGEAPAAPGTLPSEVWRANRYRAGALAMEMAKKGVVGYDEKGQEVVLSKSIEQIASDHKLTPEELVNGGALDQYMRAKEAVWLDEQGRPNRPPEQVALAKDALKEFQADPEKLKRLAAVAKDVTALFDATIKSMEMAGFVKKGTLEKFQKDNPYYTPNKRIMGADGIPAGFGKAFAGEAPSPGFLKKRSASGEEMMGLADAIQDRLDYLAYIIPKQMKDKAFYNLYSRGATDRTFSSCL